MVSYLIFSWVNLLEARDKAQAFAQDGHVRATAVGMAGGVTTLGSTGEGGNASPEQWSKPQVVAGIYRDYNGDKKNSVWGSPSNQPVESNMSKVFEHCSPDFLGVGIR